MDAGGHGAFAPHDCRSGALPMLYLRQPDMLDAPKRSGARAFPDRRPTRFQRDGKRNGSGRNHREARVAG